MLFKHPDDTMRQPSIHSFVGECENFNPSGTCAFSNGKSEMLIVRYADIIQMTPMKKR